ncbi:MAG: glycosyltransferase family 2 protein [Lachnospiraceae bacterium]|nr:glycosyltransferase family 2 protein [Lachnospiraceae bacterium]
MKISVIVCFYNAEKYLTRLFESLIQQTYKDYELILVNDGSTDESLFVCKQYESRFDNINIINKSNGGLVSARKVGVLAANSEYVCCIDADDWVDNDYIEKLVELQQNSNSDIVISGHWRELEESKIKVYGTISPGLYKTEEVIDNMLYSGTFYSFGISQYFHGKLFRKSILKEVQCAVDDNIQVGEDVAVIYPAILSSTSIFISDYCGYHYINNLNSMVSVIGEDEEYRLEVLVKFLERSFSKYEILDRMKPQLNQFYKNGLLTRCTPKLDVNTNNVLNPFGGIEKGSSIILYGAGVLGQRIKKYYVDNGDLNMVIWVDRSYDMYKKIGINVSNPDELTYINVEEYDYVIIAVTMLDTAMSIKNHLNTSYAMDENKMLWLTDMFLEQEVL